MVLPCKKPFLILIISLASNLIAMGKYIFLEAELRALLFSQRSLFLSVLKLNSGIENISTLGFKRIRNASVLPTPELNKVCFYTVAYNDPTSLFPGQYGSMLVMPTAWGNNEYIAIFWGATSKTFSKNHYFEGEWTGWDDI